MEMIKVKSSNIHAIGYDAGVLRIEFKDNKGNPTSSYDYKNVLPEDYASFNMADSKGRHFARKIKGAFQSQMVFHDIYHGWVKELKEKS